MERIEQKEDNPIGICHIGNDLAICELRVRKGSRSFNIINTIPLEKQSIPAMIEVLKKYIE